MKIKRSDVSEETIYIVDCPNPKCESLIETMDDPNYEDELYCEHCDTAFDLVD